MDVVIMEADEEEFMLFPFSERCHKWVRKSFSLDTVAKDQ